MALIYNPPTGKTIPRFNCDGNLYHKIDKEEVALEVGEILQFPDNVGEYMVKNWGFLEKITPEQAAEIKADSSKIKCPQCDFTFSTQTALEGHLKIHVKEVDKKIEEIIPDIPMATTTAAQPRINTQEATKDIDDLTKGPEWYGEGLTETRGTL